VFLGSQQHSNNLWTIKNAEMVQTLPTFIAVFYVVIPVSVLGAVNVSRLNFKT